MSMFEMKNTFTCSYNSHIHLPEPFALGQFPRLTEVTNLQHQILCQQKVEWLQVAMDQAQAVQVTNAGHELLSEITDFMFLKRISGLQQRVQCLNR